MLDVQCSLRRTAAILFLIAATLAVYSPSLQSGFVGNDTALVLRDPLIRSWRLIPESFQHALFPNADGSKLYRPMLRLSFMADYAMWEFFPRGFHLTNIFIHALAAVALFFLAGRLMGKDRWIGAMAVALLWALNPWQAPAVACISGRGDALAAVFAFSGILLGLRSLESTTRRQRLAIGGAACCFLAALLSTENGCAALLLWMAVLVWRRPGRRVIVRWVVICMVVAGVYAGLRIGAEHLPQGISSSSFSAAGVWFYLPGAFLVLATAAAAPALSQNAKRWALSLALISAAVLSVFTWRRQAVWKDEPSFLRHAFAGEAGAVHLHTGLGQWEARRGRDEAALEEFRKAVRLDPAQPAAWQGLGAESVRVGNFDDARKAIERLADFPEMKAGVHQLRGALELAESAKDPAAAMRAAMEAAPGRWDHQRRYITALMAGGQLDRAATELSAMIATQPYRGTAWKLLGDVLARLHRREAARAAFERAAQLDVHDIEARQSARVMAQAAAAEDSQPEAP